MPVEASGSKSLKYLSIFGQCGECLGLCVSLQLPFFPPYEVLQFWVPETPLPGFPGGGTVVKTLPANGGDTRDVDLIPESGRSPIEGNRNPLQHSCLENSMDRGAWRAAVHGATKSQTWATTGTTPPPVPTALVYQCNLAHPKLLAALVWSVDQGYARDLHNLGPWGQVRIGSISSFVSTEKRLLSLLLFLSVDLKPQGENTHLICCHPESFEFFSMETYFAYSWKCWVMESEMNRSHLTCSRELGPRMKLTPQWDWKKERETIDLGDFIKLFDQTLPKIICEAFS